MLPLYKLIVRPAIWINRVQAWRPHYRKDIAKLEKVQRRATKMVEGLEGYSSSDRLKILGLITLETRFLRADLIEVINILKNLRLSNLRSSSRSWEMMVGFRAFLQVVHYKGADWMLGNSSLLIGCVRSGMGWMMM